MLTSVFVHMLLIHDPRIPEQYKNELLRLFPDACLVALEIDNLVPVYDSILYHPDIYLFKPDDKTCIHAPCVSRQILKMIEQAGVKLIQGEKNPFGVYPDTAKYNAVQVGKNILCNKKYIDRTIIKYAGENNLRIVNIAQGYARCSVVPVGNNALITSDKGIADKAKKYGIKVLLVRRGYVNLPGEKYGFLGGATGVLPDGNILFLGDIATHPNCADIEVFIKDKGVRYVYINNLTLYDAGTIIIVFVQTREDELSVPSKKRKIHKSGITPLHDLPLSLPTSFTGQITGKTASG